MEWFSGSIPEAISSSKIQEAVFVVFVSDSSEASNTSESSLAGAAAELKQHTVAIKLNHTSDECKQFSQIYPVVVLPSIYFINPVTGIPVEILAGPVTSDVLADKLPAILAAGKTASAAEAESTSSTSTLTAEQSQTQAVADVEEASSLSAAVEDGVLSAPAAARESACDTEKNGDETVTADENQEDTRLASETVTAADGNSGGEGSLSLHERVARAKALAEQKRLEREEELKQKNITEEAQRRLMGKEMRRVKRDQEEKEMKEIAAERRKDKEMDRLARERVKAQIAADRAERETRAALLRGEAAPPSPPTAPAAAATSAPGPSPSVCRLKLRLPDGSSMLAQFSPSAPLSAVRQHLLDQGSLPFTQFRLASSLHQRPYSDTDMDTSLADLALAPSAIIIVMPTGRSASAVATPSGGLLNTLMWLLLLPYNTVLGVIRSVFGGGTPAQPSSSSSRGAAGQPPAATRAAGSGDAVRRRTDRPKTAYGTRTEARLRREGNIHRLGNEDDSDENNTWNGNSTQQM